MSLADSHDIRTNESKEDEDNPRRNTVLKKLLEIQVGRRERGGEREVFLVAGDGSPIANTSAIV